MSITTHQSLLSIQSYMLKIFGPHYPIEISWLIVSIYNDLIRPQIFCGNYFTFFLKCNGELYSCGDNQYKQLGFDDTKYRNTFTKVDISNVSSVICGEFHTMILTKDNEPYSCGNNEYAQLCLGDTNNRKTFTKVDISNVSSVSCGEFHTMILTKNNELYACGYNGLGQLGLGDDKHRNTFAKVNIPVQSSHLTVESTANSLNPKIISVACDGYRTMILTKDNELYACGNNQSGQLGLGDNIHRNTFTHVDIPNIMSVTSGTLHTMILTKNNELYACGYNGLGQLGLGDDKHRKTFTKVDISTMRCNKVGSTVDSLNPNVLSVTCGGYHTMILTKDNELYACGSNRYGQLCLGDNKHRKTFTKVDIHNVVSVTCGENHTMIVTKNNELYSCGYNASGQLGLGDCKYRNTFTKVNI
jgi:alpha-tubulin suppressor-like RCC1 family protein